LLNIRGIIAISVITVLVAGTFPTHAFALKVIDLPDQAPIDNIIIIEYGPNKAKIRPLYTTHDEDHSSYISPANEFTGVADLILKVGPTIRCSGSLLKDSSNANTQFVLTAAHCVTNSNTGKISVKRGYAEFKGVEGVQRINIIASQTSVHPNWDGDFIKGNDVAIVKLESVPVGIDGYRIDTFSGDDLPVGNQDCDSAIVVKAGYGRTGWGQNGDVVSSGTKHDGRNCYDDSSDNLLSNFNRATTIPNAVLQYDFDRNLDVDDDGISDIVDAAGAHFGQVHIGLGSDEVNSAPGDSGGPSFNLQGKITGITSYGMSVTLNNNNPDIDNSLNSSFGEYSGDTRVSLFAGWIDSVLNSSTPLPPPPDEDEPKACPPGHERRGLCVPPP